MPKNRTFPILALTILFIAAAYPKAQGSRSPAAPRFTSLYTDLNKECKAAFKESELNPGSDMPLRCKGYGGYHIYIYYSARAAHVTIRENKSDDVSFFLATQALAYGDDKGRKIEWRMADGVPFAVILRVSNYDDRRAVNADNPLQDQYKTGESLVIKGLKGYEHIEGSVDAKTPDANARARQLADEKYRK